MGQNEKKASKGEQPFIFSDRFGTEVKVRHTLEMARRAIPTFGEKWCVSMASLLTGQEADQVCVDQRMVTREVGFMGLPNAWGWVCDPKREYAARASLVRELAAGKPIQVHKAASELGGPVEWVAAVCVAVGAKMTVMSSPTGDYRGLAVLQQPLPANEVARIHSRTNAVYRCLQNCLPSAGTGPMHANCAAYLSGRSILEVVSYGLRKGYDVLDCYFVPCDAGTGMTGWARAYPSETDTSEDAVIRRFEMRTKSRTSRLAALVGQQSYLACAGQSMSVSVGNALDMGIHLIGAPSRENPFGWAWSTMTFEELCRDVADAVVAGGYVEEMPYTYGLSVYVVHKCHRAMTSCGWRTRIGEQLEKMDTGALTIPYWETLTGKPMYVLLHDYVMQSENLGSARIFSAPVKACSAEQETNDFITSHMVGRLYAQRHPPIAGEAEPRADPRWVGKTVIEVSEQIEMPIGWVLDAVSYHEAMGLVAQHSETGESGYYRDDPRTMVIAMTPSA